MQCAACKWWDQSGSPPPVHHRCFRYPPVRIFDGEEPATQWPWTAPTDFCGEYTPAPIPNHRQPEPVSDPYKLGATQEKT